MWIPDGFQECNCLVNRHTGDVILFGFPINDEPHNCDEMGCGSTGAHIIARFRMPPVAADAERGADELRLEKGNAPAG